MVTSNPRVLLGGRDVTISGSFLDVNALEGGTMYLRDESIRIKRLSPVAAASTTEKPLTNRSSLNDWQEREFVPSAHRTKLRMQIGP